jgi:dipeptidyl aminopeptidase/acylaminoacyl peptidase
MRKFSAVVAVAAFMACAVAAPALVSAQQKLPTINVEGKNTKLTVEDIYRSPSLRDPIISPNGKYMAATVPFKGRMNLAVLDLEARTANVLTSVTEFDVLSSRWVGNDRLVFSLGLIDSPTGADRFDGGGLYMVSRDGKTNRSISPTLREARNRGDTVYRSLRFFRSIPGNADEIIASGNMTDAASVDLYRLNVVTGRYELLTRGRPTDRTSTWIIDSKLVPRVVSSGIKDTLTTIYWYRKDADSAWSEIARTEGGKGVNFVPLTFESDDKTLQVATNQGRDTMAVFRYDPEQKKLGTLVAQHPRYDMGAQIDGDDAAGVLTDPANNDKVIGYSVNAAKPETVWLDEQYAAIQRSLDATLPNRINSFRRIPDSKRMIVTSYSDVLPARWYLYDDEKKALEEIGTSRPWLVGKLVEQIPFVYKTRDGLEIDGYYFLPADYKPGTKLPTVVHIHGGPFARADTWGSRSFGVNEGQMFAANGYAVIVPNFRITPGLGAKVYQSGFGTVGRQMSDDHEDALKWGIDKGFVDSSKTCISGASYGGYAALQALVRNNDMWKCAVAGLAVTDFEYQLTTGDGDTRQNTAGQRFWFSVLGTDDMKSQLIRDISPVNNADKIKRPVLLYAGEEDIRVPIRQISRMKRELERVGNPPKEYIAVEKEGHGFGLLKNRVDTWTKILSFVDESLKK